MPKIHENDPKLLSKFMSLVPADGSRIGNQKLREAFSKEVEAEYGKVSEADYWMIRNALVTKGRLAKGVGRGGSVFRVEVQIPESGNGKHAPTERVAESSLYEPFLQTIKKWWTEEYEIRKFVVENTARQGAKDTGGKWTRPDITLVAVHEYDYLPGKSVEAITFEIKSSTGYDIDAVFEAAAHTAMAHRSYLAIQAGEDWEDQPSSDRIRRECERFSLGLIVFGDPGDWKTWNVLVEAKYNQPDPGDVNSFLTTQLSEGQRRELQRMVR